MKAKHLIFLILGMLFIATFAQSDSNLKSASHERVISVDFNKIKGNYNTMFKECIGEGRANEGLRADWQQHLAYVKKECGFKYIRMHGLFAEDIGVYKEDKNGNPEYNYQHIDVLYDYLLSIGIKPSVELGLMPYDLASGNEYVFWWKAKNTHPKDYDKWDDLIRNLVVHFTERYGVDEVKTWYFEVWNPDIGTIMICS
jgi:xylan 1,4-beta-xylosidase